MGNSGAAMPGSRLARKEDVAQYLYNRLAASMIPAIQTTPEQGNLKKVEKSESCAPAGSSFGEPSQASSTQSTGKR